MSRNIVNELKLAVKKRANENCEYCRLPEYVVHHIHEVDHVLPIKHGGITTIENLAVACWRCNRHKGTDVGSFDFETDGALTRFFNPRKDVWTEHFQVLESGEVKSVTAEARVTVKILQINGAERIEERRELIEAGLY